MASTTAARALAIFLGLHCCAAGDSPRRLEHDQYDQCAGDNCAVESVGANVVLQTRSNTKKEFADTEQEEERMDGDVAAIEDMNTSDTYNPQESYPIRLCTRNRFYQPGLTICLDFCPHDKPQRIGKSCAAACPSGCLSTSLWQCTCRWWPWYRSRSYVSCGWSVPTLCTLAEDKGPPNVNQAAPFNGDFTMAYLGDPQFGYAPDDAPNHNVDTNRAIMRAIRNANTNNNFQGVVLTGDLTNSGAGDEFNELLMVWGDGDGQHDDDNHRCNYPIWPVLGNHDYGDNVEYSDGSGRYYRAESTWVGYGSHGSAQHMMGWMRALVAGFSTWVCRNSYMISNFNKDMVDHYEKESMGYAWTIGNHRFIALHQFPTYRSESRQINGDRDQNDATVKLTYMKSTLDFMVEDLEYACDSGMMVSLIFHDYGNRFCQSPSRRRKNIYGSYSDHDCTDFVNKIEGTCVIGVFVGHIHNSVGLETWVTDKSRTENVLNKWNKPIPVLRTGSPPDQSWLRVTYRTGGFHAQVMSMEAEVNNARSVSIEADF